MKRYRSGKLEIPNNVITPIYHIYTKAQFNPHNSYTSEALNLALRKAIFLYNNGPDYYPTLLGEILPTLEASNVGVMDPNPLKATV